MTRDRVTGIAAMLGGVAWLIKAGAILVTGEQPDYFFEVAPIFFYVGLIGLYLHLAGRGGVVARIGGIAAALGVVAGLIRAVISLAGSTDAGEEDFDVLLLGSFLLMIVSLILVGIGYRRGGRDLLTRPSLPFILGLATVPLIMVGGALEAVNERLLEIPLLVIAAGWIAVGADLATSEPGPSLPQTGTA